MGLRPEDLRARAGGGYLHDVDKIGIPDVDAILNNAGRLDDDERSWVEQHPEVVEQMVAQSRSLAGTLGSSATTMNATT